MNWQPYPQTKPPKAGLYMVWESFDGKGAADFSYYTKRDGFKDDSAFELKHGVTHWCEIVPPGPASASGTALSSDRLSPGTGASR